MPISVDPRLDSAMGKSLLDKVLNDSGKIRASLQGLVQSSQRNRTVTKRSGNRIDGRKLSRLVQGDSRIFERSTHKTAPNTALHLLVDGSSSMHTLVPGLSARRIDVAMESAMALALALEGIHGVNPAVTRFPFADTGNVVPLLKHGQKVRAHVSAFSSITSGCTPLASALWYAASAVLGTSEERKIIMVLTDGEPDDIDSVRSIIRRCESAGIEFIGVGIFLDTSHLFKHSICINDISELRSELFKVSKDLLLAA
jgi:cobalamin biosynthesis protein CobT